MLPIFPTPSLETLPQKCFLLLLSTISLWGPLPHLQGANEKEMEVFASTPPPTVSAVNQVITQSLQPVPPFAKLGHQAPNELEEPYELFTQFVHPQAPLLLVTIQWPQEKKDTKKQPKEDPSALDPPQKILMLSLKTPEEEIKNLAAVLGFQLICNEKSHVGVSFWDYLGNSPYINTLQQKNIKAVKAKNLCRGCYASFSILPHLEAYLDFIPKGCLGIPSDSLSDHGRKAFYQFLREESQTHQKATPNPTPHRLGFSFQPKAIENKAGTQGGQHQEETKEETKETTPENHPFQNKNEAKEEKTEELDPASRLKALKKEIQEQEALLINLGLQPEALKRLATPQLSDVPIAEENSDAEEEDLQVKKEIAQLEKLLQKMKIKAETLLTTQFRDPQENLYNQPTTSLPNYAKVWEQIQPYLTKTTLTDHSTPVPDMRKDKFLDLYKGFFVDKPRVYQPANPFKFSKPSTAPPNLLRKVDMAWLEACGKENLTLQELEGHLKNGANSFARDENGNTGLHRAVRYVKDEKILTWFVKVAKISINKRGKHHRTVVMMCAQWDNLIGIKFCLQQAFPKMQLLDSYGDNVLHIAAVFCARAIPILLDQGKLDIESRGNGGNTPVLHAAQAGNFDSLKILKKRKANMKATDENGDGALELVNLCGNPKNIVEISLWLEKECGLSSRYNLDFLDQGKGYDIGHID